MTKHHLIATMDAIRGPKLRREERFARDILPVVTAVAM
jgi:hypothetical protein